MWAALLPIEGTLFTAQRPKEDAAFPEWSRPPEGTAIKTELGAKIQLMIRSKCRWAWLKQGTPGRLIILPGFKQQLLDNRFAWPQLSSRLSFGG